MWRPSSASRGFRCNAISPGFIVIGEKPGRDAVMATMLAPPHPRLGRPEDIAALVVFLACDKSAFITGQNICVDGAACSPISPSRPISAPISGTARFAVRPRPPLPGICGHSRRPSCWPSVVNGDRIGVSFSAVRTRHGLADPGSGGQAGAGRNGDACPGGDGRVGGCRYPGGAAQAPTASEGRSRKPPANCQNR